MRLDITKKGKLCSESERAPGTGLPAAPSIRAQILRSDDAVTPAPDLSSAPARAFDRAARPKPMRSRAGSCNGVDTAIVDLHFQKRSSNRATRNAKPRRQ